MSWLRLDDDYDQHPKLLELTEAERWRWTRVLLYCARLSTGGEISTGALHQLGVGKRGRFNFLRLELLEPGADPDHFKVHDFEHYNPNETPAAERMRRFRERNALRNDPVTDPVTSTVTLARGPASPTPSTSQSSKQTVRSARDETDSPAADDELSNLLERLGIEGELRARALEDPARAHACALSAEREGVHNPGGYFRRLLESGEWPAAANGPGPSSPPAADRYGANVRPTFTAERVARLIRNGAVRDERALELELADLPELAPAVDAELRALLEHEHGAPADDDLEPEPEP